MQEGLHQWAIGSVTVVSPHSAIDSDLTDNYLNENLIKGSVQPITKNLHALCFHYELKYFLLKVQNKVNWTLFLERPIAAFLFFCNFCKLTL